MKFSLYYINLITTLGFSLASEFAMAGLLDRFGHFLARQTKMVAVEHEGRSVHQVKTSELISNLEKPVIKAEIYEIPAADSGNSEDPAETAHAALNAGRATLVTLDDKQTKYLIRKTPSEDREQCGSFDVTVWHETVMRSSWRKIEEKSVENEKLGNYLEQLEKQKVCEKKPDIATDPRQEPSAMDVDEDVCTKESATKEEEDKKVDDGEIFTSKT